MEANKTAQHDEHVNIDSCKLMQHVHTQNLMALPHGTSGMACHELHIELDYLVRWMDIPARCGRCSWTKSIQMSSSMQSRAPDVLCPAAASLTGCRTGRK